MSKVKHALNIESTICKSLLEDFVKEKTLLKTIVSHIIKTHKNVTKILVVDNINHVSKCSFKSLNDQKYAISNDETCCYINNVLIFQIAKIKTPMRSLLNQHFLAVLTECKTFALYEIINSDEWNLTINHDGINHLIIYKNIKNLSDEKILSELLMIQLTSFFKKMCTVHYILEKKRYHIVNKLKAVEGEIGSIKYDFSENRIIIANHILSDPKLSQTKFYEKMFEKFSAGNYIILDSKTDLPIEITKNKFIIDNVMIEFVNNAWPYLIIKNIKKIKSEKIKV